MKFPAASPARRILAVVVAFAAALGGPSPALPAANAKAGTVRPLPAIVIERDSGAVLIERNAFDRWYPASLTKLMTVYVALRAIASGSVRPSSPVVISKLASAQPPSSSGLAQGSVLRLDQALPFMIVKSANDLAVAVAESVAGSVPAFVAAMNREAARLGMSQTKFANPNGLQSQNQFTSARDMALLARQILVEFPGESHMFAAPALRAGGKTHHSYNLLLERFAGADGMKTGFVCASGYNMVATATRSGRQLIAVVAGAWSQTERAVESARLLLEGFADVDGGTPLDRLKAPALAAPPRDQRARMCSQKALKERYDPAGGEAVIDSPFLEPRRAPAEPRELSLGGADPLPVAAAEPPLAMNRSAAAGKVPVPQRRPAR
jgi:D-alanyl-D-alanine carboxypeptidase